MQRFFFFKKKIARKILKYKFNANKREEEKKKRIFSEEKMKKKLKTEKNVKIGEI